MSSTTARHSTRRSRLAETALLCFIASAAITGCRQAPATTSATPTPQPVPTFSNDIAPIIAANCTPCHRPGQGAPFTLLTYEDARTKAEDIAEAVGRREMPPWLPEPIQPAFVGERRLRQEQIETLRRWQATGAVQGDPQVTTTPPVRGEWESGTPDLILRPARAYSLNPGADDVFRNLVIRTELPADRHVRAVEFRPGDAPIHHAVLHLDATASSRSRDGKDGQPGFEGMGAAGTHDPDGHFIGWAAGRGPIVSAEGRPWRLAAGTDVVVELHLIPQKAAVQVRPTIGLYFADSPTELPPLMFKMGSNAIDIPPGATDYAITDSYTLPADVSLLSVYPHAHFLGKDMQVYAVLPDGKTKTLLHIRRWSFHWQQDYRYTVPVALPRGTTITMRFTYDNSDANKDNPHHPPVRVVAGQQSTDEMGNLLLQMLPASAADRVLLERDIAARLAVASVATNEQLVRLNPGSSENLALLGASYADAGRLDEAIATLNNAIRINPSSWKAHNELGGALFKAGQTREAANHFREASRLNPKDASVHYNLGKALIASGDPAAGKAALTRALALNPDLADAHDELGVLLFASGRIDEAIRHLRQAVRLKPNSAIAQSDLGGALAQAGKTEEALVHIRAALALDPSNAAARENLARLQRGR